MSLPLLLSLIASIPRLQLQTCAPPDLPTVSGFSSKDCSKRSLTHAPPLLSFFDFSLFQAAALFEILISPFKILLSL